MRKIICLFFFVVLVSSLEGINCKKILEKIPPEDRLTLCSLFTSLMNDHFAYTLFGDKPVSLAARFILTPWENTLEGMQCSGIFWKKWKVWEQYKHLFTLKNFLLIKEPYKNKNFNISIVLIINKIEFIKTVNVHLSLFESVLERKIIPEEMLKDIESNKLSFMDSINNNQMLLGILLGYGKHNSILYNRRERNYFDCLAFSGAALKNSSIKLECCGDYSYSPLVIESIHFSADLEHPETKALEKRYRDLRGLISAIYAQGDFLEITLSQLVSDEMMLQKF